MTISMPIATTSPSAIPSDIAASPDPAAPASADAGAAGATNTIGDFAALYFDALNVVVPPDGTAGARAEEPQPVQQPPSAQDAQDTQDENAEAAGPLPAMAMQSFPALFAMAMPAMPASGTASVADAAPAAASAAVTAMTPAATVAGSPIPSLASNASALPRAAATSAPATLVEAAGVPSGAAGAAGAPSADTLPQLQDTGSVAGADRRVAPPAHNAALSAQEATAPINDREAKPAAVADMSARNVAPANSQFPATVSEATHGAASKPNAATGAQPRQALIEALGERIQVQVGRRIEHAVIRLDPPMMGSIEVVIRHEAGNLQVQLNATHGEVQRQLQAIGDSLRQDLAHRQYTDVSVLVSNDARGGEGRQRQRQPAFVPEEPGRALAEGGEEPAAFSLQFD